MCGNARASGRGPAARPTNRAERPVVGELDQIGRGARLQASKARAKDSGGDRRRHGKRAVWRALCLMDQHVNCAGHGQVGPGKSANLQRQATVLAQDAASVQQKLGGLTSGKGHAVGDKEKALRLGPKGKAQRGGMDVDAIGDDPGGKV